MVIADTCALAQKLMAFYKVLGDDVTNKEEIIRILTVCRGREYNDSRVRGGYLPPGAVEFADQIYLATEQKIIK